MAKKSPVIQVPVPGTFVDFGRRHIPERTTGCCKFIHFSGWMQVASYNPLSCDSNVVQVATVKVGNVTFSRSQRSASIRNVQRSVPVPDRRERWQSRSRSDSRASWRHSRSRSRPEPHSRSKNGSRMQGIEPASKSTTPQVKTTPYRRLAASRIRR
ncbi:hypothetical protein quinque_005867 [Culex quinquefasciatus]